MDSFEDFDVLVKEYLKDQRILNELREKTVKKLCLILAYQKKRKSFLSILMVTLLLRFMLRNA